MPQPHPTDPAATTGAATDPERAELERVVVELLLAVGQRVNVLSAAELRELHRCLDRVRPWAGDPEPAQGADPGGT